MRVPNVRANRQFDRASSEVLGCSRTTNPRRVLLAGVFGNHLSLFDWTSWKQFPDTMREPLDVLGIELLTSFGGALAS
jgi:hypothetical protein